ncbi:hypothetical protein L7F22_061743 [Adiantum nelumboides]|nr:hypothetical protein [Adiantum nelumboides]
MALHSNPRSLCACSSHASCSGGGAAPTSSPRRLPPLSVSHGPASPDSGAPQVPPDARCSCATAHKCASAALLHTRNAVPTPYLRCIPGQVDSASMLMDWVPLAVRSTRLIDAQRGLIALAFLGATEVPGTVEHRQQVGIRARRDLTSVYILKLSASDDENDSSKVCLDDFNGSTCITDASFDARQNTEYGSWEYNIEKSVWLWHV